jgi:membrane protein
LRILLHLLAESRRHDLVGESAKVSFFLMFSLFPLVLVLLALTGLIGGDAAFASIVATLQLGLPPDAATGLEDFLLRIAEEERPGLFSIAVLLAVWAASIALFRLTEGFALMHGLPRRHGSWIERRVRAVGVLLLTSLVFLAGLVILLAEPHGWLDAVISPLWNVLRWPLSILLLSLVMGLVYFFLPARGRRASRTASFTGGMAAAALWVLATGGLRFYVHNVGELGPTFAPIGTVIVAMGWIFATSMALLIGVQVVAVLEARRTERRKRKLQVAP